MTKQASYPKSNVFSKNVIVYTYICVCVCVCVCVCKYIHLHVFRPAEDSSVCFGLTSREQLISPECSV